MEEQNNKPHFVTRPEKSIFSGDYVNWLSQVKKQYGRSQVKAAVEVNTEMLRFYWYLGCQICEAHKSYAWGSNFLEQVSLDLREEFPDASGFSENNLYAIRRWYNTYNEWIIIFYQLGKKLPVEFSHQAGGKLEMPELFAKVPWRHHVEIVSKSKSLEEALFYVRSVANENWSRSVLVNSFFKKNTNNALQFSYLALL